MSRKCGCAVLSTKLRSTWTTLDGTLRTGSRPAKSNPLVIVLLPDPFGPAMTVRTGNCQAALRANSRMVSKFRPRGAPGMKRISKRRPSGCSMISSPVRSFR
jgi:hypothetical protein